MSDKDDSTTDDLLDDDVDTDRVDDADEDKELGPAGQKALTAEKEKRRAAAARARKAEEERDQLKTEVEKLRKGATDDDADKPDADAIRKQARDEAKAETLLERAMDKVETRAAKLFADPEDARLHLAKRAKEFIDDGEIDVDAINEALQELLEAKPHLAATATTKRFAGGADGGARNGTSSVAQLTKADLDGMTPEQIVAAKAAGRFNKLLGIK